MRKHIRQPALWVAFAALFVSLSGGAIAAKLITGKNIKNGSITAADLKSGTVSQQRLAPGVVKLLNEKATPGAAGPAGPAGAAGPAGPAGAKGDAGAMGDKGDDGTDGADGADGAEGPEGPQGPEGPTNPTEYGVAAVCQGTTKLGTVWTGDIPDDGNNAAQVSGTVLVPAAGTVTIRGAIRSSEQTTGTAGQLGGSVVTQGPSGALDPAGSGQTAPNTTYGGVAVVDAPAVAKTSGVPGCGAGDPGVVVLTVNVSTANSVLAGNLQAFDFPQP